MTRIFIAPEELPDYHQQILGEVPSDLHLVAKDDDEEACLYISDEDGMPVITATLHGIEVEKRDYFEDSDDLENVAKRMYAVYVGLPDGDTYKVVDIDDDDDNDEEYTDQDLVDLFGKDDEAEMIVEDFEDELNIRVDDVVELLSCIDLSTVQYALYREVIDVIKENICKTLTDYGFSVYRPTIVVLEDGTSVVDDYPYGSAYTGTDAEE